MQVHAAAHAPKKQVHRKAAAHTTRRGQVQCCIDGMNVWLIDLSQMKRCIVVFMERMSEHESTGSFENKRIMYEIKSTR